jgi:hypothetical protein
VTNTPQADLGEMLAAGQIDALISADVPKCFLEKSPKVARLFEDHVSTERAYFERTGIFPIMHTVAIRKQLATDSREVVKAVSRLLDENIFVPEFLET